MYDLTRKRFKTSEWDSLVIVDPDNGGIDIAEKICELCKTKFFLQENQHGLVFNDKFFICEDCHKHTSEDELNTWSRSIMRNPQNGMPISLWLIHEQNKGKDLYSTRHQNE